MCNLLVVYGNSCYAITWVNKAKTFESFYHNLSGN